MAHTRQVAPRKVYRLISGIFDDNTGRVYKPDDEIVTRSMLENREDLEVEYLGLYESSSCASCCGGKIVLPDGYSDHLEVIHKGGSRWGVYDKISGEKIHNGWLTKEEAEEIEKANETTEQVSEEQE